MKAPLLRPEDRLVAGVCSGLAGHLGWSVNLVRALMVLLAVSGGAGLVLYAWLWILVPTAGEAADSADAGRNPRSVAQNFAGHSSGTPAPESPSTKRGWIEAAAGRDVLSGLALLAVAAVFIAQRFGADINWRVLFPLGAIVAGAVLAWSQLDEVRRAGLLSRAGADRRSGLLRLAAGLLLVVVGVLLMVSGAFAWDVLFAGLLAASAVLAGVALVFAPWAVKYWRELETERAGRIRERERAEIAAHLHDSVLQTLALIQNRAGSEQDVVRLARAQERELRRWLYADDPRAPGQLSDSIAAVAAQVEDEYGYPVEVVTVGDAPLDAAAEAMTQAARAALVNAAQHAGGPVSVYVECTADRAEIFIRDRGTGFDPDTVPPDRLGVRESIVGRMRRNGGTAVIRSGPEGTEVRLGLPLSRAGAEAGTNTNQTSEHP
ncbi:PspC domain-containing protein [Arthrobacter gengyunqii]|uniref:PspC domain-containing protein n=1 Tax=Arthrobacter gengyunqii TaxID=2886940 RepID=A0A9X1S5V3_9MICC|nr:ATP-binding protein [Arthrobacter gengyunqii]MCC3268212.1 PspC domain-containing protein [Arthrobacter gengyunqii]UOY95622.1 PspC domain-containing protein [Arthrobacter gengyunqii]